MDFIQIIFMHPLLWLLLSIAVIIWGVFKVQDQPDLQWFDRPLILFLWALGAIIGGDWYITLRETLDVSFDQLFSVSQIMEGEKGSVGAMLGVAISLVLYLRLRKIPILENADKIIPFMALSCVAARVGCFFNGDDFGVMSNLPWAVSFGPSTEAYYAHLSRGWISPGEAESLRVHPAQLYHAIVCLAGFFLLKSWQPKWQGSRFALAWVYYGVTRFFVELFRDEYRQSGTSIDTAQWFSLLFIIIGLLIWFHHKFYLQRERLVVTG